MLMKKICRHVKNRESHRQRQSKAAENRAAGLRAQHCDVGLTSTGFKAALLDINGSLDLPDISMKVTECHCSFLHLQCQHCRASTPCGRKKDPLVFHE